MPCRSIRSSLSSVQTAAVKVQTTLGHAVYGGFGDQEVHRTSGAKPLAQIAARNGQVRNGELHHVETRHPIRERRTGTMSDHQRGQRRQLLTAMPRTEPASHISSDDQEERCLGILSGQMLQRLHRVARSPTIDLDAAGLHTDHVLDGRRHHSEPVGSTGNRACLTLLPRIVGHDQEHVVQVKLVTRFDGNHQVADVDRVEGASQHADPPASPSPAEVAPSETGRIGCLQPPCMHEVSLRRSDSTAYTAYAGVMSLAEWTPRGWREQPADQQPDWPDAGHLQLVEKELAGMPPLVFAGEARRLKSQLARVTEGNAFVLQAGDCAESFDELSADAIRDKLRVILQMAVVLTYGAGVPVVKLGRIAGQFAKPRSWPTESVGDEVLPVFRGHMVNDDAPSAAGRRPDPERLLTAYHHATATLNLVRAFTKGGFADLSQVHAWNQQFVASSDEGRRYEQIAAEIDAALRFMTACGIDLQAEQNLHQVDFFTSHEALILPYEEALTRRDSLTGDWYDCSAHMLWIGERTRRLDGAHVEFLSGVQNPIGCKVGPSATVDEVLALCERLDPHRSPGRLTLITRMGASLAAKRLPMLFSAVRNAGFPVVWVCDPMHGNTFTSEGGRKTRRFDDILTELRAFFDAHGEVGSWPGGIHVELTGDDVTECLGGYGHIVEDQLHLRYTTTCDPRLNARQSIDLAFRVAELLRR